MSKIWTPRNWTRKCPTRHPKGPAQKRITGVSSSSGAGSISRSSERDRGRDWADETYSRNRSQRLAQAPWVYPRSAHEGIGGEFATDHKHLGAIARRTATHNSTRSYGVRRNSGGPPGGRKATQDRRKTKVEKTTVLISVGGPLQGSTWPGLFPWPWYGVGSWYP